MLPEYSSGIRREPVFGRGCSDLCPLKIFDYFSENSVLIPTKLTDVNSKRRNPAALVGFAWSMLRRISGLNFEESFSSLH